ncbi:MAG: pteridine reductase [Thioalkalivibrionaceae bacterium]
MPPVTPPAVATLAKIGDDERVRGPNHASTTAHAEPDGEARVALVTGSARRIGRAIAEAFHARGLSVVVHYRNSADEAIALVKRFNSVRHDSARAVRGDLLDPDDARQLAQAALAAFGRVDVLVHNASTFYPTPIDDDEHCFERAATDLLGSNLIGPLRLTRALHHELHQRRGAIVHIVDIHALRPLKRYSLYCAAKAGLWSLTQSLARELGPEIRVNGVAPGAILEPEAAVNAGSHEAMIDRTALKRAGLTSDIAGAVAFLALDAPYITGQVLPVDGGRSASQ